MHGWPILERLVRAYMAAMVTVLGCGSADAQASRVSFSSGKARLTLIVGAGPARRYPKWSLQRLTGRAKAIERQHRATLPHPHRERTPARSFSGKEQGVPRRR